MGPTPFYGARAKKTQKADFAMKQTNICRLSGDIKILQIAMQNSTEPTVALDLQNRHYTRFNIYADVSHKHVIDFE